MIAIAKIYRHKASNSYLFFGLGFLALLSLFNVSRLISYGTKKRSNQKPFLKKQTEVKRESLDMKKITLVAYSSNGDKLRRSRVRSKAAILYTNRSPGFRGVFNLLILFNTLISTKYFCKLRN